MSDSKPIPIVVCGGTEEVGKRVVEGLKPEYEVVLFCLGADTTALEVPYLLQGSSPPSQSSHIGSGNLDHPPRAIVFGSLWGPEHIAKVMDAIRSLPGGREIAILRNDNSKSAPPPTDPSYGKQIVARTKDTLAKVLVNGEKVDGPVGVSWY